MIQERTVANRGTLHRIISATQRAAYAFAGLLLCEVGARMAVPAPDAQILTQYLQNGGGGFFVRLYNQMAGGAMARGSMLALGIMPYISARIFLWLAGVVSPAVHEMSTHQRGRTRLTRWTLGLTSGLAFIQSYGFARFTENIPGVVAHPGTGYILQTTLLLTAGATFMGWLCEQIMEPLGEEEDDARLPPARDAAHRIPLMEGPHQQDHVTHERQRTAPRVND